MGGEPLGARKKRSQVPFAGHAKRVFDYVLRLPSHAQNKRLFCAHSLSFYPMPQWNNEKLGGRDVEYIR
jgi:hypothetical protein